ncbi:hypothetical protein K435DRAFT_665654, partial [Dendrothele bispora CBS 962.96]
MLYPEGHGYPLWTPELDEETLAYHENGIKVGDVRFITWQDGGSEFLFNISLPGNHYIHKRRGLPRNFEPLKLDDEAGYSTRKNQIPKEGCIHSRGSVFNVWARYVLGYELHSRHSEGAALLLPQGASRTDYRKTSSLHAFAAAHAESWYRYFLEQGYSDIQNGSLYIISGFLKTACYYAAV